MRILRSCVRVAALLAAFPTAPAAAQGLDLGIGGTGASIGNSNEWTGVRLNWRDDGVRRVDGLNLTVWRAGRNPDFRMRGIALGVVGPEAATISGIAIGLGGVVASRQLSGIALAGLGVVSEGDVSGIAFAGLGTVAQGDMTGVQFAGLGLVSQGRLRGISLGGLAVVAADDLEGINLGGLAAVAQGNVDGISVSGLATVAQGNVSGISITGLATVAQGDIRGLTVSGLATVASGAVHGIAATLGATVAPEVRGLTLAAGRLRTEDFAGVSIAGYNQVVGVQRGLTIGLYNKAAELHGVQLGLVNFAGNNRGIARWLPLVNAHF